MKNIYYYICWLYGKADKTDLGFTVISILIASGLSIGALGGRTLGLILVLLGFGGFVFAFLKLLVYDAIKRSYNTYKREQQQTFNKLNKDYDRYDERN